MKLQIFAILLTAATCLEAVSVKVTISDTQVEEGVDVSAQCTVKDLPVSGFIYWVKKVPNSEEIIIGTNTILNRLWMDTKRYGVAVKENADGEVTFTLTITGVKAEDGGDLGCKVPQESGVVDLKPLVVIIPVREVVFEGFTDGQKVGFEEGVPKKLVCHVKGGSPEPTVQIMSGNNPVTDKFEKKVIPTVEGEVIGLQRITYLVTLTADYVAAYSDAGRELSCQATVGKNNPMVKSSIKVSMQFSPKFDCGPAHQVKEFTENVTISCVVNADPGITDVYWFWETVYGKANQTLRPGNTKGAYTALSATDGGSTTVQLRIKMAYHQHFRRYTIIASNELGEGNHTIELQKVRTGEVSGANSMVAGYTLFLSFILTLAASVPGRL